MEIFEVVIDLKGKEHVALFTNRQVAQGFAAMFRVKVTPKYVSTANKLAVPKHGVGNITKGVVTKIRHSDVLFSLSDGVGFWDNYDPSELVLGAKVDVVVRDILPLYDGHKLSWHYVVEPVGK